MKNYLAVMDDKKGLNMNQLVMEVKTSGKGLYSITSQVREKLAACMPQSGLLNLFLTHTSASLLIQENSDPTAKADMEEFLERIVPEGEAWHRHTLEGPDDTTAHLKATLTNTFLNIPICDSKLGLGIWQGIYLWEHRNITQTRRIILTVIG